MDYKVTTNEKPANELWQEKTARVFSGGFKLDMASVPVSLKGKSLPKGTPLLVNHETRTAQVVLKNDDEDVVVSDLVANTFNYAEVSLLSTTPSVSGVYRAYEVKKSKLPYELSEESLAALSVHFIFIK